ncbi:beta-lactamase family protein [Alphaproteobacteria bacterium KMM 3653]|uniref:Beta-lactamase family protein n=1 Tax=Harenicola maris TaxID=2841044 RepID=A0AAP2CS41_9RHOB|nr:beta-lactamase family protein [Harenicola maris]
MTASEMSAKTKNLRSMLRPYTSPQHAVVGFQLSNDEETFISTGTTVCDARCEDWLFEIASITKVLTAILLCVLIEEGKIDPKAPLRAMSEVLKDVPDWVTPESLTSHTSGLPNYYLPLWKAVFQQQPDGPYVTFSRSDLLAWLHNWRSKAFSPPHRHAYSNLGVGLLGEAMAIMEDKPFVELLADKVTGPIGLLDTTDQFHSRQQHRFAQPKSPKGRPVPPWTFQSLAAAGCLRSSARDLTRFATEVLRALNSPETVLDRAICRSAAPILGLGPKGALAPTAQCSGWLLVTVGNKPPSFLFHNGGTAGSACALHICPERNAAIGILSNNGIAGNLWSSTKLNWSNPMQNAANAFAKI